MELLGVEVLPLVQVNDRLNAFLSERSQSTSFPDLKSDDSKAVWKSLLAVLQKESLTGGHKAALSCCRLLSRDPVHLDDSLSLDQIGLLLQLGGLGPAGGGPEVEPAIRLEAKKVLSNLIHQSRVLQTYAIQADIVPATLRLIGQHGRADTDVESRRFDFRLLFLVTALCPEQRTVARNEHGALGKAVLYTSVVDLELFPGSEIICSGSGKNKRADKLKFYYNFRQVDFGLYDCSVKYKWQIVGRFVFLIDYRVFFYNFQILYA